MKNLIQKLKAIFKSPQKQLEEPLIENDDALTVTISVGRDFSRHINIEADFEDEASKYLSYLLICFEDGIISQDIISILANDLGEDNDILGLLTKTLEMMDEAKEEEEIKPAVSPLEVIQ